MNSEPFVYQQGNHKPTMMPYWLLPESIMDERDDLREWVDKSVAVSRAGNKKKKRR